MINLTEQEISAKMRSDKMIEWILKNKERIDAYTSGNIQFSFTNGTLKVKDENYDNI